MGIEMTFVMVKGDAIRRGLVGRIISRFEDKGLTITGMRMLWPTPEQAERLYEEHKGRHFYGGLLSFTCGSPAVAMLVAGNHAIALTRNIVGATDCLGGVPGSIRGDFGCSRSNRTLIHASRTKEDSLRESAIFFDQADEVRTWDRCDKAWTTEDWEREKQENSGEG